MIPEKKETETSFYPVVGIGSAADEIENLKKFISDLPKDSGMSYIVMENLSVAQTSDLTQQLAAVATIPVNEIVNKVELSTDQVYVVPPNNFLIIENGTLQLLPNTRSTKTADSINLFFSALAQKYESYAIGLTLSWSLSDGAIGLKKIKEIGGAAVSAITKTGFSLSKSAAEYIDYFTTPEEAVQKLLKIKNSYLANRAYDENLYPVPENDYFSQIVNLIVLKTGTNFHKYKSQTIRRRIAKRMVITRQETVEQYFNLLKNNTIEQDFLFNDILIPVTYFFRDQSYFDCLYNIVFPALMETINGRELRIWSAGCSTGEEAYSLAIILDEFLKQTNNSDVTVKIFASDLSEKCIEKARIGIYTLQDLKNVSESRQAQYFTKTDKGYQVNKIIRHMCIFAVHDLTKDFPFSHIDLILCRNVLIYFDSELQNHILAAFHYALREKGFLFLGRSESTFGMPNLFDIIQKQEKIYIRKHADNRFIAKMGNWESTMKQSSINIPSTEKDFKKIAADVLLDHYSPAAVIINEDFEIVHFHGDISMFLQPSAGKPSFNIINMLPNELRFGMRNVVLRSRLEKKNFYGQDTAVKHMSCLISYETVYLPLHPELLLIIFSKKAYDTANSNTSTLTNAAIDEKKLLELQGDLQQLTEEQQIYFEELQTTNEELLKRTEELQSLNEQLEISAEELRSNNEELSCTNDELTSGRHELVSTRNFYNYIVKIIRDPLLIIDKDFIVQNANEAFYRYFSTRSEDVEGYAIFELGQNQWNTPEFKDAVLKKISKNETVPHIKIKFPLNGTKKTMLINASPMTDSVPLGMYLISFEDITDLEDSTELLKSRNAELLERTRQLKSFTAAAEQNLLEPIRKIYMFGTKILDKEKGLSDTGRHHLKRLLHTSSNMNQIITDLIQYSHINSADKKFKKTDLNILMKKAIQELKPILAERKAVIETESLPILYVLQSQMQLVFKHLILNAVKYSKPDNIPQINIRVNYPDPHLNSSFGAAPDSKFIKITISDNGIGFEKNFERVVFNPFYRLGHNDQSVGSGLGLTLVQQVIWNHNGIITISSEPGEGTAVHLYLPIYFRPLAATE